jgi:NADP-dependent 3-hydroxy acid dehydrogenase YdfG
VIAGRRVCKLEEVSRDLGEKYAADKTVVIRTDVTVPHDVENLFARTAEEFGRCPDVVLANAGVLEKSKRIAEQDVDAWWNSMVGTSWRDSKWKPLIESRPSVSKAYFYSTEIHQKST